MRTCFVATIVALAGCVVYASDPDPRLATVRKAFVVAVDDLAFDRPVAACLADHISTATPIVRATKEEADVVLRISATDTSDADRLAEQLRRFEDKLDALVPTGGRSSRPPLTNDQILAMKPKATIVAELPDGTKLWETTYLEAFKIPRDPNLACALADDLLKELREAMKKARDPNE